MIDIFYGRVTDNLAHVYVRTARQGPDDTRTITGWVRGPICSLSHTLPATIALRDMGPGPTLLGTAAVPDPCFWSTQLPAQYEVRVELCQAGQAVETFEQTIGIRRLGAAGRNLLWEGKRWVLRGVGTGADPTPPEAVKEGLQPYRAVSAAMIAVDPAQSLCAAASSAGVVIVARLTRRAGIEQQLADLARCGAVAMAILPTEVRVTRDALHNAAPNLLLAQQCTDESSVKPADWADLVVCQVSEAGRFHEAVSVCPLPLIAERQLNEAVSVAQARGQCDLLQRDLAPGGDYAGYVVTNA